jgi:hypothetical protein
MANKYSENGELFTDYAIQLLSAFLDENQNTVTELMSSYEKDKENELSFLPGVLYGCMIHMSLFISTIADYHDISPREAFQMYATSYNTETRKHLSMVDGLHPEFAEKVLAEQLKKINMKP